MVSIPRHHWIHYFPAKMAYSMVLVIIAHTFVKWFDG